MAGLYINEDERTADFIISNSVKAFSFTTNDQGEQILVPSSKYEREIHLDDKAEAIAKLAIDKAMTP